MKKQTKYKTKQQIFDKVYTHFVIDKKPKSYSLKDKVCKYYSKSGGCAIGCLIEDDKFKKQLDLGADGAIEVLRVRKQSQFNKIIDKSIHTDFLSALQAAHDTQFSQIKEQLEALARGYDLDIPVNKVS